MVELPQTLHAEIETALARQGVSYSLDLLVEQAVEWAAFVGEHWGPTGEHGGLCSLAVGFEPSIATEMLMLAEAAEFERSAIRLAKTLPVQELALRRALVALDDALSAVLHEHAPMGGRLEGDARAAAFLREVETTSALAHGFAALTPESRTDKLRAHQQRLQQIAVVLHTKIEAVRAASGVISRPVPLRTAS